MQVFLVTMLDGCWFKVRAADVFACAERVSEHYGDWSRIESLPANDAAVIAAKRCESGLVALNKVKADAAAAQVRALSALTFEELRDVAKTLASQSDSAAELATICASLKFLAGAIREAA